VASPPEGRRPLRLAFRAREGLVGGWKEEGPSVSRFERGRGWWMWLEGTPPGRVVVVEGEVELQQVVKFNMHVTCHVIFSAGKVEFDP